MPRKDWMKKYPNYQRDWQRKVRQRAYLILGHACVRCGFTDQRALCFDHVNDDGAEHRRLYKIRNLAQWVVANPEEAPKRLQVLCANCNLIKEVDRRYGV